METTYATGWFGESTRRHLRYPSGKGNITTEDLWDLPLTAKDGFDLENVAQRVNAELKATQQESFVKPAPSALRSTNEIRLETIKAVIAYRIAERDAATLRAAKKAERERLMHALETKSEAALQALSADEVKARIAALNSELQEPGA